DHHDHQHDDTIGSLSLTLDQPIHLTKFENWMADLRANKGQDLLRYKGILDVYGQNKRLAIQGVHMMMEGSALADWPEGATRQSKLVFIGRDLDRDALREGFEACRA
ncbi:MAG: GTP-binding protein, partial [Alphaproteobacteria bacterium]|nr:GTP-binding protein [Alphaproteobacteria bacterium]